MKQDGCVVLPASTNAQLSFMNGAGEDKFLNNIAAAWNGSGRNADSLCRSGGSLSSSITNATGVEAAAAALNSLHAGGGGGRSNGGSSATSSPQLVSDLASGAPTGSTSPVSSSQQTVFVHVNPGETLSVRVGNDIQHIPGPATVRMVSSHNSPPPMALPLHVPPGHIVQQIIDESGVLRHVILSPQTPPIVAAPCSPYPPAVPNGAMGTFMPVQNGHHHNHGRMASPGSACQTSPSSFYPTLPLVSDPHHICQLHINQEDTGSYGVGPRNLRTNRFDKRRRDLYSDFRSPGDVIEPTLPDVTCRGAALQDDNRSATTSGTEDDEVSKIGDMLSSVPPPRVCEVGPLQALVHWLPFDCSEASASGGPFPQIDASEFTYQVLLFEKRPDGTPKANFRCQSDVTQQWLADLKPSTEYFVRLRALLEERGLSGDPSSPVSFKTKPSQPDKPLPPRLSQRMKTALLFRWTAPCENGSRVVAFHLELQRDQEPNFHEAYVGANKQAKAMHLSPSTLYRVRLAASNQHGKSEYSDVLLVQTSGAAPQPPEPPKLIQATATSLLLEWARRDGDDEFRLTMEDPSSGHGFLPVCVSSDVTCTVSGLHNLQDYYFRLCAANEDGVSAPSDTITYRTAAGEPQPPSRLTVKTCGGGGSATARSVQLMWQPPQDSGGGEVLAYYLQYAAAIGESPQWCDAYAGVKREFTLSNLPPGTNYLFRVACETVGGHSQFSEVTSVSTSCVSPGTCQAPTLNGKARQSSLNLKWAAPEFSGGSEIVDFEVAMETSQVPFSPQAPCIVYKGPKTECGVGALSPGNDYSFRVRARNKTGHGQWSTPLQSRTIAAPPDPPIDVCCVCLSCNSVSVRWQPPEKLNGAPVTEYRLQQAMRKSICLQVPDVATTTTHIEDNSLACDEQQKIVATSEYSPLVSRHLMTSTTVCHISSATSSASTTSSSNAVSAPATTSIDVSPSTPEIELGPFVQIFVGNQLCFDAKDVKPALYYAFRVQAVNMAGASKYSSFAVVRTPSGPPDAPSKVSTETLSCGKINVSWDTPCDNGSQLIGYNLDVQPAPTDLQIPIQLPVHCAQYLVENLRPETTYIFRVQAFNDVDVGPMSSAVRCSTYSLPPLAPHLELASAAPGSLKLRWSEPPQRSPSTLAGGSTSPVSDLSYVVEVENRQGGFSRVYEGVGRTCKAQRLTENTSYRFRLRAIAATAGQGGWSPLFTFKTTLTPPPAVKDQIKVTVLSGGNSYAVEWQPVKAQLNANEKIVYSVQLCSTSRATSCSPSHSQSTNAEEVKTVYKGSTPSCTVSDLPASFSHHRVRVAALRCTPATCEDAGELIETASLSTSPHLLCQPSLNNATESNDRENSGDANKLDGHGCDKLPVGWTDRQCAVLILVGFMAVTVFVAILLQQLVV